LQIQSSYVTLMWPQTEENEHWIPHTPWRLLTHTAWWEWLQNLMRQGHTWLESIDSWINPKNMHLLL
jgi:hypothetical protein